MDAQNTAPGAVNSAQVPAANEADLNAAELKTDAIKLEADVETDITKGKLWVSIYKKDGFLGLVTHLREIEGDAEATVKDAKVVVADVRHIGWSSPPVVILIVSVLAPIALTGLGHEVPAWQSITGAIGGVIGSGLLALATVFAHKFAGPPPVLPAATLPIAPVPPVAPGSKATP
jgi:hypothetical protein